MAETMCKIEDGWVTILLEDDNRVPHWVTVSHVDDAQTDNQDLIKEWGTWLAGEMEQPFGTAGQRNTAAVNVSILLRALGVKTPSKWINDVDDDFCNEFKTPLISCYDDGPLGEAFDRVDLYLDRWDDGKGGIIKYMLD